MRRAIIISALLGVSNPALAADDMEYGAAPGWVQPAPAPAPPERQHGAFSILLRDMQAHFDDEGQHLYEHSRFLIQTSEGLALGNLTLAWNPAAGGPDIHVLKVIRDGEEIDILKDNRFSIFQREGGLEQSMLDGLLTASLQVPGLRVGDELEFAVTTHSQDPTLPDHSYGILLLPSLPSQGAYRARLTWDDGHEPHWTAHGDISEMVESGRNSVTVSIAQPDQFVVTENAPLRYPMGRIIEYSAFEDWPEVSRSLYPLYEQAAVIPAGSELEGDVARIMRNHSSESERARAALRLVQDQVRYVYVGLNGGNMTPASVEETWERRYGDCKDKTVLLLALLQAMGIEAEPVTVSLSTLGAGLEAYLPSPGQFDHVLVRATVDGQQVWLDGTRHGDTRMNPQPPEPFRNVLPLTRAGAELETLPFTPPEQPQRINITEMDATAGIDRDVVTTMRMILRGADALQLRAVLQSLPPDALDQTLRNIMGGESGWKELQQLDWSFDEAQAAITVSATGLDELDWDRADDWAITEISIPGADFYPPAQRRRPPQQDRSLPYLNDPYAFTCHVTTIKLPETFGSQGWEHDVDAMNRQIGGVADWRVADLNDGEVRTIMSTRTVMDEITAAQAEEANAAIPDFDNAVSHVALRRDFDGGSQLAVAGGGISAVPATYDVNWLNDASACRAPS